MDVSLHCKFSARLLNASPTLPALLAALDPWLFRDFLDWKGLVLIEPTALTHNPDDLSDEKKRKARMEANQEVLRKLGLA